MITEKRKEVGIVYSQLLLCFVSLIQLRLASYAQKKTINETLANPLGIVLIIKKCTPFRGQIAKKKQLKNNRPKWMIYFSFVILILKQKHRYGTAHNTRTEEPNEIQTDQTDTRKKNSEIKHITKN